MTTTTQIDIQPFCDPDDRSGRYKLHEPFVTGGFRCATDGRIAVAVPSEEPQSQHKHPNVPQLVAELHNKASEWVALPDLTGVESTFRDCEKCKGTGYAHTKECLGCRGDGVVECSECGHEDDCDECRGKGYTGCGKCAACDGKKKLEQPYACRLLGLWVQTKYEAKIRALGEVEVALTDGAISFRSGELKGVLMGLADDWKTQH